MNPITGGLQEIARLAKTAGEPDAVRRAIGALRAVIQNVGARSPRPISDGTTGGETPPLHELDQELSTWQSKLDAIWKEPFGREGMAKHAKYWMEKLECHTN